METCSSEGAHRAGGQPDVLAGELWSVQEGWVRQVQHRKESRCSTGHFTPPHTHSTNLGDTWELPQEPPVTTATHKCLCSLAPTCRRTHSNSSLISPLSKMGNQVNERRFAKWERPTGAPKTKTPSQIAIRRELLLRVIPAPVSPHSVPCLLDAVTFICRDACLKLPQVSCPH